MRERYDVPSWSVTVANSEEGPPLSWTGLGYLRVAEGSFKRGVEISYVFKITSPLAFQLWKYGLTNPYSLVWELFTLSFVVDWFTGLGNFFSALDSYIGVSVLDGYETQWLDHDFVVREQLYPNPSPTVKVDNASLTECKVRKKAMIRYKRASPGIPLPYLKVDLDLRKARALIALIIQRI